MYRRYIGRRLLTLLIQVFALTLLASSLIQLIPGDPAVQLAGESATPAQIARVRHLLGLDRSWIDQYVSWLWRALHGNLGTSIYNGEAVTEVIKSRVGVTVFLTLAALLFALVVGSLVGTVAALRAGGIMDRLIRSVSSMVLAVPSYWLGLVLIVAFAVKLRIFPSSGYVSLASDPAGWFEHLALPVVSLGALGAAEVAQHVRGTLLAVLPREYTTMARAKGLPESRVVLRHAGRILIAPILNVVALLIPILFGGALVIEQVFSLPGIGAEAVTSVVQQDLPVVQGITLVGCLFVLLVALIVDLIRLWVSPRQEVAHE